MRILHLGKKTRADLNRLLALIVAAAPAFAAHGGVASLHEQPLEEKIRESDHVYHVAITSIDERFYVEDGAQQLCGTNYSVRIIETLKGLSRGELKLSVYTSPLPFEIEPLRRGDELVVLIADEKDSARRTADPEGSASAGHANTESECLRQLSSIRLTKTNESAFLLERSQAKDEAPQELWFRYMSGHTAMPAASSLEVRRRSERCLDAECRKTGFFVARWTEVRRLICSWSNNKKS
jgi:hypothetical protein